MRALLAVLLLVSAQAARGHTRVVGESCGGIVWRLRIVDVASRTVEPVEATLDLHLHSVVWLPATPGC